MTLYCDRIFWMSIIGTLIVLFVLCPVHCLCDNMVREFVNLMVIIAVSLILNFSISKKIMGHCSELFWIILWALSYPSYYYQLCGNGTYFR